MHTTADADGTKDQKHALNIVVATFRTKVIDGVRTNDALKREETTVLEPAVVDNKYYAKGIGELEEVAVRGPLEKLQLVEIIS